MIVPLGGGEAIADGARGEISILVARDEITITHARCPPGQQIARPHVHHEHTDAFYVLDGELTFVIGRESDRLTVSFGTFVAVPPLVAHSLATDGESPARWLAIHARDGGFAAFMRGVRDGVPVAWDMFAVPPDGGLSAGDAVVSPGADVSDRVCRLRCALADLSLVEWNLAGPDARVALPDRARRVDTFLVLAGELEVMAQTAGPETLASLPPETDATVHGRGPTRLLSLHTPDRGVADFVRSAAATGAGSASRGRGSGQTSAAV